LGKKIFELEINKMASISKMAPFFIKWRPEGDGDAIVKLSL
jgi:hypothetical protein